MRQWRNAYFFALVVASEANAWVRIAGGNVGLQVAGKASAFGTGNGDPVLFALNAFVIGVAVLLSFPKWRTMGRMLLNDNALLMLYGYSFLSVLWSPNFGNSFRIAVYLFFGLLEFGYLGLFVDTWQQVKWLGNTMSLFALLSLPGQFLLRPSDDPAPGWTGIFPNKNYFGNVLAIGIVALLFSRERWGPFRIAKLALCTVLLLLSQSFTSLLCVLVCAGLLVFLHLPRRSKVVFVGLGFSALLLVWMLLPNFVALALGASGKSTDLTGRDVIWAFALKHIALRPILGYGYYGFWLSENDAALQYLGWNPNQAHNGFLDLALNEGLVGVCLLLVALYTGWQRSRKELERGDPTGAGRWLLLLLAYLLVHNVSEADFYQRPAWVVYLAGYCGLARVRWLQTHSPETEHSEAEQSTSWNDRLEAAPV